MNKIIKILIFLGILWLVSYGLSSLLTTKDLIPSGDEVAVIPISGMITLEGQDSLLRQTTSAEEIIDRIDKANNNPSVKAIVLDINSPGGTVMGSKRIADKVKEIDKPMVAVISEFGTSGAYWIASQSDIIIADELSIVGSIGVIGSFLDFSGFLDDHNITYNRLVTGEYKDINSPLKVFEDDESDLIQERLDKIHDFFVSEVAEGRGLDVADVDPLADGLFYLGMDAIELGLIDELGDKEYAIDQAKKMANLTNGRVQEYEDKKTFFQQIREYTSFSSFYIGQGIGSVLVSNDVDNSIEILA